MPCSQVLDLSGVLLVRAAEPSPGLLALETGARASLSREGRQIPASSIHLPRPGGMWRAPLAAVKGGRMPAGQPALQHPRNPSRQRVPHMFLGGLPGHVTAPGIVAYPGLPSGSTGAHMPASQPPLSLRVLLLLPLTSPPTSRCSLSLSL